MYVWLWPFPSSELLGACSHACVVGTLERIKNEGRQFRSCCSVSSGTESSGAVSSDAVSFGRTCNLTMS